jgi:hypothetical protein
MSEPGRKLINLLSTTVALGAFRSVLAEVVALADKAANLSDEQLRATLMALDHATHRLVGGLPPGVLHAHCGALLPPVTVHFSDHPPGSPVCAACTERTTGSGPVTGWPPVELPTLIPGGQPDSSLLDRPDERVRRDPGPRRKRGGQPCPRARP